MPPATGHFLHELPGGARVLTAPMPDRMSASVVLMFGVGSRFEPDDIVGTAESVSSVTRDDLVDYLREHYRRSRLVVGVSGGIDPDRTADMIDRGLGLAGGPAEGAYDAAPDGHRAPEVVLLEKKTEQAHICLGSRALSYMDPDRYALDLVNTVLGEGMSSRLFLEIREQRGLAYDVHSYSSKHRDSGYFAVYMGVDPKKAEEAVAAALEELRRIAEQEVPESELTKAKEFTKGRLRLGLESTNAMASWLAQQLLLTGTIRTVDEVIAIIDGLTAADLRGVAARVMGAPTQMAGIGPFPSAEPFRKAIGA